MSALNAARLVAISMWLGAALFFSAVVAPAVFGVLRSFDLSNANELAGTIVTRTLSVINVAGFVIGALILLTFVLRWRPRTSVRVLVIVASVFVTTIATGVGHWLIAARMRALRVAMKLPIDQVPLDDPRHASFQNLHGYSVTALGIAMIAALLAVVLLSREPHG